MDTRRGRCRYRGTWVLGWKYNDKKQNLKGDGEESALNRVMKRQPNKTTKAELRKEQHLARPPRLEEVVKDAGIKPKGIGKNPASQVVVAVPKDWEEEQEMPIEDPELITKEENDREE